MIDRARGGTPFAAAVLLFSLAVSLTGCVGGSPAGPTPKSAATEAPSPEPDAAPIPADPLESVTSIVARPEALELRDDAGVVVQEFDYLGDPDAAVGALTEVLGADPVAEERPGDGHYPPSTAHRWEGLALWEQRHEGRWAEVEHSILRPRFMVEFTGPSALGIDLTTVQGVHAGEPWADLLAEPGLATNPSGCSGPYLDFVEVDGVNADGTPFTVRVSVDFRPTADESVVARVGAPVPASDGCA